MPGPKPLDPSSSPRAMLGAELRHKREEAGLTQEELGKPLFVSGSFIGQLEAGTRRMQMEYAVKIDEILGTDGYFTRNCEAATKSKYPDHFAEAAEAEAIAASIREYAPQLIPGLVQVLPFKAGGHAVMGGALKLMNFDDAPPLTYFEGPGTGVLEDDPATVTRYELAYDLVGASALSPQDSLALIESVAEDYANEDQP